MSEFQQDLAAMIKLAKDSHSEALGELLRKHDLLIRKVASEIDRSPVKSRVGVSDAVQDTYADIIIILMNQGIPENVSTEEEFVKYLRTVARNNVRDIYKQQRADKRDVSRSQSLNASDTTPSVQIASDQQSPASDVGNRERGHELRRLLHEQLPSRQARAIELVKLDEVNIQDAAKQLDCTESALASLLRTGLRNLRQSIPKEKLQILFASIVGNKQDLE